MAKKKTNDSKVIIMTVVVAIIAFGGGYLVSNYVNDNSEAATAHHAEEMSDHSSHHSEDTKYEVTAAEAPSVQLMVTEDSVSGWNVHILTENFTFTPENVNGTNILSEGHAHLYVDGEKVARVYGNYFHYPENFDGSKEFMVTLNANDHSEYAVNGVSIMAMQSISHSHE